MSADDARDEIARLSQKVMSLQQIHHDALKSLERIRLEKIHDAEYATAISRARVLLQKTFKP